MISTTVPPTTVDVSGLATSSAVATIDTVVDSILVDTAAIKAVTNNLPNSGALTNLDVAVSSVKLQPQTAIYRETTVSLYSWSTSSAREKLGYEITSPAITASAWPASPLFSITDSGFLWYVAAYRRTGFTSATLSSRITIDGTVWTFVTDGTSATSGDGHIAHGMGSDTVPVPMMIRFNTSLKIELTSSSNQDAGDCAIRVVYSLD